MLKNLFSVLLIAISTYTQAQHVELLQQGQQRSSIRGLSVVDDNVAWVSGSRGAVGVTIDGGKTWRWQQVKGFEKGDFRDIEAFSDKDAVIMSSGTPALILRTTDGGANWDVKYKNTDTTYFLDAMDFSGSSKQGWVLGDPIKNEFLLLMTPDGGNTWTPNENSPNAVQGEAAFAASGTCLRIIGHDMCIVSGGTKANLIVTNDKDKKWGKIVLPLAQGKASQGAFSVAKGSKSLIIVGGDYAKDKKSDSTACYSINDGKSWRLADKSPEFQSSVEYIKDNTFISTGTPGSNITTDGGKTWTKIDAISYNVCRKAKKGALVLLAGDGGKIGILKL
jgi:photosystem II stability/assembly factor-like uncharacterized protein